MLSFRYTTLQKSDGLVLGLAVSGETQLAVGGQGRDLLYLSHDGGRSWSDTSSGGNGLRNACVTEDSLWVVGEWGHVARSVDGGETWRRVDVGARACLFGAVPLGDEVIVGGDDGFVAAIDIHENVRRIHGVDASIGRMNGCRAGVLLPVDGGGLFVTDGELAQPTSLVAETQYLMSACETSQGSYVVVGTDGIIMRSDDEGLTWTLSEVHTDERRGAGCLSWVAAREDLVFVVGEHGALLCSEDDGCSFFEVKHSFGRRWLWSVEPHPDGLLIGADRGELILARR